tara:strand:+ start:10128 stop:10811 length:684 start_codon:yes stop_codon:yes gene_type:complete
MVVGKQFWDEKLGRDWTIQLKDTLKSKYSSKLMSFLATEYALNEIKPAKSDIFNAFKMCPWDSLKVVILGSEPCASTMPNGLAFGDNYESIFHSPILCTIFECIEREYHDGLCLDFNFSLEHWAQQGVLLLNRSLTTRVHSEEAHKKPWGKFISAVLNSIVESKPGTIFILWGEEAQLLAPHISKNNYILTYDDPKEFVYPAKDWHCTNFKEVNVILEKLYGETINW